MATTLDSVSCSPLLCPNGKLRASINLGNPILANRKADDVTAAAGTELRRRHAEQVGRGEPLRANRDHRLPAALDREPSPGERQRITRLAARRLAEPLGAEEEAGGHEHDRGERVMWLSTLQLALRSIRPAAALLVWGLTLGTSTLSFARALRRYARARQAAASNIAHATDSLQLLFAHKHTLVVPLRNQGMTLLNRMGAIKNRITQLAQ